MAGYSKILTLDTDNDVKIVADYLDNNKPKFCEIFDRLNTGFLSITLFLDNVLDNAIPNSNIDNRVMNLAYDGLDYLNKYIKKLKDMFDPEGNCVSVPYTYETKKVNIETLNDLSNDVQLRVNEVLDKLKNYKKQ